MITKTSLPATPAEVLSAAADRIQRYGWLQCEMYPGGEADIYASPCCARAAIWLSIGIDPSQAADAGFVPDTPEARLAVTAEDALADHLGRIGYAQDPDLSSVAVITSWNDAFADDADAVICTLRAAAKAAAA